MAHEVIMPKNGMSMEEGKLIRWLKEIGDTVEQDEPIIEIETDKITMEEPAGASGVLLAKWAQDGDTVAVLKTIGWIGQAGEAVPEKPGGMVREAVQETAAESTKSAPLKPAQNGSIAATPYARTIAAEAGVPLSEVTPTGRHGEITAADVRATPLARRIAAGAGVNLGAVCGTGSGGKIRKADVQAAISVASAAGAVRKPMSAMRKAVARNMAATCDIPQVTQHTRADVTELLALRAKINEGREDKITLNDLVLKAVSKALMRHPEILVSLDGEDMLYHNRIHLGFATALNEGLIVPVVFDADKLSLTELSETVKDLAAKAKNGSLTQDEYTGSTFTVSNLGMYGVELFTPVINLPNAAIMGVCAIVDELAIVNGMVEVRKKMGLSLTYDHRLMDGATAGTFSMAVRGLLERPLDILI